MSSSAQSNVLACSRCGEHALGVVPDGSELHGKRLQRFLHVNGVSPRVPAHQTSKGLLRGICRRFLLFLQGLLQNMLHLERPAPTSSKICTACS